MSTSQILLITYLSLIPVFLFFIWLSLRSYKNISAEKQRSYSPSLATIPDHASNTRVGEKTKIYFSMTKVKTSKGIKTRTSKTGSFSRYFYGFNVSIGQRRYFDEPVFAKTQNLDLYFTSNNFRVLGDLVDWKYSWKDVLAYEIIADKTILITFKKKSWPVKIKLKSRKQTYSTLDMFKTSLHEYKQNKPPMRNINERYNKGEKDLTDVSLSFTDYMEE